MKYEVVAESCRICLQKSIKMRSLYKPHDEGDEPPDVMLHQLTGICLEEMNMCLHLPKFICKSCELSLNLAFQFRAKALKSQAIIEIYCKVKKKCKTSHAQKCGDLSGVKQEMDELMGVLDEDCIKEDDLQRSKEIKIETLDVPVDEARDEELLGDVEYLDVSYIEEEAESSQFQAQKDVTHKTNPITENAAMSPVLRESEDDSCDNDTEDTVSGMRADPTSHICDICGNIFAKRARMMEHRRRHNKELRYACELCDKRFHLREKLRKHMFLHSGSKPYKCSFCSRSFYYESVKKAHEAIHKGHKPYVCTDCNKSFAYAHALKKHVLIHYNIKLYHCEYCNKDFRLQHHMKQHELTKLHLNAVRTAHSPKV